MAPKHDILIVDDEPIVVLSAQRTLVPAGLSVDHAGTVAEGLSKADSQGFNLVLADLMLPDHSGFDLVTELRRLRPELPIVVVTGYATLESAITCFKTGVFDFVAKPFETGELLGSVQRALRFQAAGKTSESHFEATDNNIEYYGLGKHVQVRVQPSGLAVVTLGVTFPHFMGKTLRIELPESGTTILQGNACAKIINREGEIHIVRAPLTGSVLEINSQLPGNMKLLDIDPFNRGWLVRMAPTQLKSELQHLTGFARC